MRGMNKDEICDFVELTRHKPINVRFIKFMPFDGNVWNVKKLAPMQRCWIKCVNSLTAWRDFKTTLQTLHHVGTISFITSMTRHFCAGCNRLRLLSDGNFKVCLFG
ncbi:hypothetical protein BRADI_3g49061v3 [Brachypodium distachyon]|uniref:Molybdenum cofactor biosynthesis protein A-like twitch domain-containing protein n=1 Tax=Brachypodium distachyon TaxID=15368 RepID=A0A2K2D489_BRADI|nr:hypothetical protein BRADI_3g49061v3 [Brachypodium distachyon]PNT69091.1 hypothetical protein BRADI_3g49061v3 [Brachypodium distachyon]PNT69093.1 hypothetical protein BRADI_3g49061v3 [Brachypodium distachyon]